MLIVSKMGIRGLVLCLLTAFLAANDLFDLEIQETETLIRQLKRKNELLRKLNETMQAEGREIPVKGM